jgi:glutaredoxin
MYSRRRCGLCDEARTVLQEAGAAFDEITIDGDDVLEARYGLRVPVILVDGEERFEVEVDAEELRRLLAGA